MEKDNVLPNTLYQWHILQQGQLPIKPTGRIDVSLEHRCTSILIWPEKDQPCPNNSIVTDPCFTNKGFKSASHTLSRLGLSINDMKYYFITHKAHLDHNLYFPPYIHEPVMKSFNPRKRGALSGLTTIHLPGHHPKLYALSLQTKAGYVWVVGDAVLDEEWLKAWEYFWPNGYLHYEIIQTWRSLAKILSQADIIIPGHGSEIKVTKRLIGNLIKNFSKAEYAKKCPDVLTKLQQRL